MKLFGRWAGREQSRPALSRSGSRSGSGIAAAGPWPLGYEARVREAYERNPVARRAVALVAQGVGEAPLEASDPALVPLVAARSGGQALLETLALHLMLHGNAYAQVLRDADGGVAELYALRPERVSVVADAGGWPAAYRYTVGTQATLLSADPVRPELVHVKTAHPLDDHYGLGCLGGAIGALLGQAVDARLLAPKARQGPRLTELAVQTSSYGTQIPKLFGTMRVAGTVIWATDLKETRGTQGSGKGQPKVNAYSYSASFAVALSGRPILGVRRIWAEGKLLRGSGGDWKTRTGFRLHLGDEGQTPDPLIASVERVTPAHRGVAYAVFEDLQLADFGNRIPSLTFEVVADAADIAASAVAAVLADEVEGTCALMLGGFAASGGSVGGVIETLGMASGAWFGVRGARVTMRDVGEAAVVVEDAGVRGTDAKPVRRGRSIAAADTVPAVVSVAHYDPARDYQTGVQLARRPGAGRAQRVEVPAVITAGVARGIAERVLARADAARVRRTVATGLGALAVGPGDTVTIAGETGSWRVAEAMLEDMVVRLALVPLVPATSAQMPIRGASAGRVLGAGDALVGRTVVHAFETPALDGALLDRPRLTIAAAGSAAGWRQAGLLYSVDDGASWIEAGGSAAPAVLRTVVVPPAFAPSPALFGVIDAANAIVVVLAHSGMTLGDADDAALDAGVNLAMVGDELVQFGRAEPLGSGRWRLSRLLRGRRGTEGATDGLGHVAGERFVLLEADACQVIDLPPGARGMRVRVLASGVGDTEPVTAETVMRGVSVLPPSPVQLRSEVAADGSARVTWVRRSRAGWAWIDGVDVPLGEEAEGYRVVVTRGDGSVRTVVVGEPVLLVGADDRADGPVVVAVSMLGTNGESVAVTLTVSGSI